MNNEHNRPLLVSVIIPNWNGKAHLPTCLDALRRQTHAPIETIVVDNASTDGSQALIAADYPEVRLIELASNQGFAGAVNRGIEAARGDIIALLNNDTEADPQWVAELVRALDDHPDAGFAASKLRLFDRRHVLHSAGDTFSRAGQANSRGVWEEDGGQYDREEPVFSGCGGAVAYRRGLLEDVGLFDEDFFFNLEDVDLAWRAQLRGYGCVFVPTAVVYHKLSATGGGVTASYYTGRNAVWLIAKDYPGDLLRRDWPRIVAAQLAVTRDALGAWRGAAARARLRGQLAGVLGLPRMMRKRRDVQRRRRVALAAVDSLLID
ncbi:MAG: glycosyltransferase family 2 protein [Anaerolineae bacterium]